MLKIAIIGIGNAGNQVANLGINEDIPAFCINTSEKDLGCVNPDIPCFLLGNVSGVGKDRTLAKNLVKSNYKALIGSSSFDEFISPQDVIFVVNSTGGGTGSGVSIIMTDILSRVYPNKLFINVGILPDLGESIGAQRNTLEYLQELKKMDKPFVLYDNYKYKADTAPVMMNKINNEIIDMILHIKGSYSYMSQFGMIDDADMMKLLTVPGMINVSVAKKFMEKDLEEGMTIDSFIVKAMKTNGTCIMDKDRIIKRMGVIINLNKGLTQYYDSNMSQFKSQVGEPIEIFEHYFVYGDDEDYENRIAVILSGLSIPDDRIQLIVQRIQEVEEALRKKKEQSLLDNIKALDSLKVDSINVDRTRSNDKANVDSLDLDFLDKY